MTRAVPYDTIVAYLAQRGGSSGSAPVAPANTVAPVVSGTATVGQTLSSTTGTWTGDATIVFTYQWQRAGVNIAAATDSTYVLVDADYGSAIRCVVTGTNGVGNASANSNATAAVVRTYAQEVLADSPGLYWKFDETSGNSMADTSGNGLTGTRTTVGGSGPVVNQSPLITNGKSVLFSSVNTGYVTRPDDAHLDLGDTFTLEAFATLTATGGFIHILQKGSNAYDMYIDDQNKLSLAKCNVAVIVAGNTALTTGTTYHLVVTKSGATTKLYVNAVDDTGAVTNATCANTADDFEVGRHTAGSYYNGKLDEVAVYPTALSAARVAAHYAARTR